MQNRLQSLIGVRVTPQRTLRLRRPVQRVFAEQRVVLRLQKPADGLSRLILRIVVVTQCKRGSRGPDVRAVLDGERGKLFVRSGRCVVERTGGFGVFFLACVLFRGVDG